MQSCGWVSHGYACKDEGWEDKLLMAEYVMLTIREDAELAAMFHLDEEGYYGKAWRKNEKNMRKYEEKLVKQASELKELRGKLEAADELVSSNSKFVASAIVLGQAEEAAHGLKELLGITTGQLGQIMIDPLSAIKKEFAASEISAENKANLKHVLAGTKQTVWENKKPLAELLQHQDSKAAKLEEHHIVALRLYTTSAFSQINDSLRKRQKPHPLPATTYFISEALKQLKGVAAKLPDAHNSKVLWRGLKNLKLSFEFLMKGGTELASLATSTSRCAPPPLSPFFSFSSPYSFHHSAPTSLLVRPTSALPPPSLLPSLTFTFLERLRSTTSPPASARCCLRSRAPISTPTAPMWPTLVCIRRSRRYCIHR
jgi:hypothetical protein